MANKKDKFAQMQKSREVGSFQQTLVQAATTVAAIERQQEVRERQEQNTPPKDRTKAQEEVASGTVSLSVTPVATRRPGEEWQEVEQTRFMRLPIPQIPLHEHNLVTLYCNSLPNMTRQDFVELAIIEKLHSLGRLTDEEFEARRSEIRSRPPRGQRKGLRNQEA